SARGRGDRTRFRARQRGRAGARRRFRFSRTPVFGSPAAIGDTLSDRRLRLSGFIITLKRYPGTAAPFAALPAAVRRQSLRRTASRCFYLVQHVFLIMVRPRLLPLNVNLQIRTV